MFTDYWKYRWVIHEPFHYRDQRHLVESLDRDVIDVAERKVNETTRERLERRA
jgi:hypothetical protein